MSDYVVIQGAGATDTIIDGAELEFLVGYVTLEFPYLGTFRVDDCLELPGLVLRVPQRGLEPRYDKPLFDRRDPVALLQLCGLGA